MTPDSQAAVITGMGVLSAFGDGEEALRRGLFGKESPIAPVTRFDTSALRTRVAALVPEEAVTERIRERRLSSVDRTIALAALATETALEQAGVAADPPDLDGPGTGVIVGTGAGCVESLSAGYEGYHQRGPRGLRPTTIPRCMFNAISSHLSMRFGLRGPNYVTVSACAASTVALGLATRMVRAGHADRVLCGGTEALVEPATFAAWDSLGVMSRTPDPASACRPFDRDRDGTVLGEGAAMFVVESRAAATARGATIRAVLRGYGESSDATHITRPDPAGQARAIRAALREARLAPEDIGFISAHGTGTPANDPSESAAIRDVFGAAADRVPVVSFKPYVGHLLGASGAVETAAAVLALEAARVPPNLALENPDPACNVNLVRGEPVTPGVPRVVKNSFGFGGNNAVLVLTADGA